MTIGEQQLLDWVLIALSAFNTVLPIWLGLTILLNAERRTWGIWLAGLGMLATGAFFIFHSAMLEGSYFLLPFRIRPWWYAGWLPVIILPLGWYVAMLWFAGFWEKERTPLRSRHRFGLPITCTLGAAVIILLLGVDRPSIQVASDRVELPNILFFFNTPLPIYIYSFYIILCLLLSLDALRRMAPSGRTMGDLARKQARPWLVATSIMQIVVSLLVTCAMLWLVGQSGEELPVTSFLAPLTLLDLVVSILIAGSIIMLGEAIISYEIFTGKVLPRQGLRRHWKNIVIVAAGYSVAVSTALQLDVPQFYTLLGTTIVIAIFYALLNWRSYVERDRYLEHLRPFIGSQQLYERMVSALDASEPDGGIAVPFHALCSDVLGARLAYLAPLGPLAPIAGPPIAYPRGASNALPWLAERARTFTSPDILSVQLDPELCGGAVWAIPLWSERGLIGALLLGEKLDGGLYTQEEIEIARASGERLIDMQAGAEMARRLVELQRQRMAESQVVDARTRRVLHDDLLPQIHSLMLSMSGGGDEESRATIAQLGDLHKRISDLLREIPIPAAPALARVGLLGALKQVVDGELRDAFDEVRWEVDPEAEKESAHLSSLTAEVLYYAAREAMRNAARYGRRADANAPLVLRVAATMRGGLHVIIEDNGTGIDPSRRSDGGSGQGLALHGTMMAVVGGSLVIESERGSFTRVVLSLGRSS